MGVEVPRAVAAKSTEQITSHKLCNIRIIGGQVKFPFPGPSLNVFFIRPCRAKKKNYKYGSSQWSKNRPVLLLGYIEEQ